LIDYQIQFFESDMFADSYYFRLIDAKLKSFRSNLFVRLRLLWAWLTLKLKFYEFNVFTSSILFG
jgi:hypothetical protein